MKCYSMPVRGARSVRFAERKPRRTSAAAAAERRRREVNRLEQALADVLQRLTGQVYQVVLDAAGIDLTALSEATRAQRKIEGRPGVRDLFEQLRVLSLRLRDAGELDIPDDLDLAGIVAWLRAHESPDVRVMAGAAEDAHQIIGELQRQGAVHLAEEIGQAAGFIPPELEDVSRPGRFDPAELAVARRFLSNTLSEAYEGLSSRLSATVTSALDRGLTDGEIADLLTKDLPVLLREDAYTIARTATTVVYNLGRVREGGLAGQYLWGYRYDVIVDPRTTKICLPLAGKLVAKAELRWMPPFHYNCRTTLTPIMTARYGGPANPRADFPDDWQPDPVFDRSRLLIGMDEVPRMPAELPPLETN